MTESVFTYKYHGGPNDGETFTTVTKISHRLFYVPKPDTHLVTWRKDDTPPNAKMETLTYEVYDFNLIFQEGQDWRQT